MNIIKKIYLFKLYLFFILFVLICNTIQGQVQSKKFTLMEVIELAKSVSADAFAARHRFLSSYWQYNTFKANYLPVLTLDATLPSYNKSIQRVMGTNGTYSYPSVNQLDDAINLTLKKTVGITGGQLFMNSYLQRSDNLGESKNTSYLSTPLVIGFSQPLSMYNYHRWAKKIEPLRFEEAKKRYLEEMEDITIKSINIFFDLYLAQMNVAIAQINQANNDTLYKIAEKRYQFGKIAENELLQIQLAQLNSNNQLEQAKITYQIQLMSIKSFLKISDLDNINLVQPNDIYDIEVDVQKAFAEAKNNRSETFSFERSILEAQSYLSSIKAQNLFSANLYCNFGLTQQDPNILGAYNKPLPQEKVTLGISIPILDWGLSKGRLKMAESNQQLVNSSIEQQIITFKQNIFLKVMMFNTLCNQLFVAAKADTVSQKRYQVTKQRYLIGKIGITEVNIALSEQDIAKRGYVSSLRTYWIVFHELRRLTLFDIIKNEPISFNIEDLIL